MSNKFVPSLAAFRLYEDGTESGSSPIEAQDTDTTGRDVNSDSQVHLRVLIDETGAGSIAGATATISKPTSVILPAIFDSTLG